MKKDTYKTEIVFLKNDKEEDLFGYFPNEFFNRDRVTKVCYAHVGQHGACSPAYAQACRPATKKEYKDLLQELKSLGYNLNVLPKRNFFNE
jgi:hypothetical protein